MKNREHLENATKAVNSWPRWKKSAAGMQNCSEETKEEKILRLTKESTCAMEVFVKAANDAAESALELSNALLEFRNYSKAAEMKKR